MTSYQEQDSYLSLREIVSAKIKPVVAWIGSGLSVPANLPSWGGLKTELIETLRNKAASFGGDEQTSMLNKADQISREKNNWTAFGRLRKELGPATYRQTIERALLPAGSAIPPENFSHLWRMGIRGVLNLSLDQLVTKAYFQENQIMPEVFNGKGAGNMLHILKKPQPFIANLHGTTNDFNSWVFTKDELKDLLKDDGYKSFIQNCAVSDTLLFVGITAEDISVGGHFRAIREPGS